MTDGALIQAERLRKTYGDFTAVDGIDFEVAPGRGVRLPRPERRRASRSTMRMIGCVSPRRRRRRCGSSGSTRRRDGRQIRARLGVVPQLRHARRASSPSRRTSSSTAATSTSRAPSAGARAAELLEFVQLTDRATSRVEPLSGGMKRRLTIARSLINEPELLLLDEPTTGLDPQARHILWDRLYRLKQQGVTLVLTTHYMDEAEQLCDRLVVMDGGRIVAEGSPRAADRAALDAGGARAALRRRHQRGPRARDVAGIGERLEVLPDRMLVYADDGEAALAAVHARGAQPESALVRRSLARGRVPAPHRSHAGRLTWRWHDTLPRSRVVVWQLARRTAAIWRSQPRSRRSCSRCCTCSAMGVGVGALVDQTARRPRCSAASSYFAFIAPGLLATTAMMVASSEATWPVLDGFKWTRAYHAMAATPLGVARHRRRPVLWLATPLR